MSTSTGNVKRIEGDGLNVKLETNTQTLEVSGDGCKINLRNNSGKICVIGDGCRLRINYNTGNVEYRGDGGRIIVDGPESSGKENVLYMGDGGIISVHGKPSTNGFQCRVRKNGDRCSFSAEMENSLNEEKEQKGKQKRRSSEKVPAFLRTTIINNGLQLQSHKLIQSW